MSQSRLDDLYDRLTSRKFLLTLLGLAFALWNYMEARMTAVEFQTAVTALVVGYGAVEGVTDAAAAWHSSPDTTVRTTVNTGTETPPSVAATTTKPARKARPSRAKGASA